MRIFVGGLRLSCLPFCHPIEEFSVPAYNMKTDTLKSRTVDEEWLDKLMTEAQGTTHLLATLTHLPSAQVYRCFRLELHGQLPDLSRHKSFLAFGSRAAAHDDGS